LYEAEPLKEIHEPQVNDELFAGLLMVTDGRMICVTLIETVAVALVPPPVYEAVIAWLPATSELEEKEPPLPIWPCRFEFQTICELTLVPLWVADPLKETGEPTV
jgi:hypothetical protein